MNEDFLNAVAPFFIAADTKITELDSPQAGLFIVSPIRELDEEGGFGFGIEVFNMGGGAGPFDAGFGGFNNEGWLISIVPGASFTMSCYRSSSVFDWGHQSAGWDSLG